MQEMSEDASITTPTSTGPERLDDRDLADIRQAAAALNAAQARARQAQAQTQQAAEEAVRAEGAYQFVVASIARRYALTETDRVADDGAIVRGA
ncbi:MAG: hypothetical protein LC793_24840 [Thermomicrobia bacterium]|nr:hypothetical protein [Thermomicrobia bacterium]